MTSRALLVTPDRSQNSVGRAYSLWLLLRHLGWTVSVVATSGDAMWPPLAGTEFAATVQRADRRTARGRDVLRAAVRSADLVMTVKPVLGSFEVANDLCRRHGVPLIADVDDPDLEIYFEGVSAARRWKRRVDPRGTYWRLRRVERHLARVPVTVSNPVLAERYHGVVIPHAREDVGPGSPHVSEACRVAFVGTSRQHKGVGLLREAVARLSGRGTTLTVTDDAPPDARPWERWTGPVPFTMGMELVARSDVVVIPSESTVFSRGQLPAKLMDAMLAGRAVVTSDLGPMAWALGGTGLTFPPGDLSRLQEALERLTSPAVRADLGARARERALAMFTVSAVAPDLAAVLDHAVVAGSLEGGRR